MRGPFGPLFSTQVWHCLGGSVAAVHVSAKLYRHHLAAVVDLLPAIKHVESVVQRTGPDAAVCNLSFAYSGHALLPLVYLQHRRVPHTVLRLRSDDAALTLGATSIFNLAEESVVVCVPLFDEEWLVHGTVQLRAFVEYLEHLAVTYPPSFVPDPHLRRAWVAFAALLPPWTCDLLYATLADLARRLAPGPSPAEVAEFAAGQADALAAGDEAVPLAAGDLVAPLAELRRRVQAWTAGWASTTAATVSVTAAPVHVRRIENILVRLHRAEVVAFRQRLGHAGVCAAIHGVYSVRPGCDAAAAGVTFVSTTARVPTMRGSALYAAYLASMSAGAASSQ